MIKQILLLFLLISFITADEIKWKWIAGSDTINTIQNKQDNTPTPDGRQRASSWVDSKNNIYVFGGMKADGTTLMNDLWKFNGSWTLIKSNNFTVNNPFDDPPNIGAREKAVSWTDEEDNLYLFGGYGHDAQDIKGYLSDLWKFNGEDWSLVKGIHLRSMAGVYGDKGVEDDGNRPGGKASAGSFYHDNTLYLFGGETVIKAGQHGLYNDLWKFNISTGMWTWISGNNETAQEAVYGSKGVEAPTNVPGARMNMGCWSLLNNTVLELYVFGGTQQFGKREFLNDVWKYNTKSEMWTWVSGDNQADEQSTHGDKGIATDETVPSARENPTMLINPINKQIWMFGGQGFNSKSAASKSSGFLNDLWLFNLTHWTWMGGTKDLFQPGVYGTLGVEGANNIPGSRQYALGFSKITKFFNPETQMEDFDLVFSVFGGYGFDKDGDMGYMNDLWNLTVPKVIVEPEPPFEFTDPIIVAIMLSTFILFLFICLVFGLVFYCVLGYYEANTSGVYGERIKGDDDDDDDDNSLLDYH